MIERPETLINLSKISILLSLALKKVKPNSLLNRILIILKEVNIEIARTTWKTLLLWQSLY